MLIDWSINTVAQVKPIVKCLRRQYVFQEEGFVGAGLLPALPVDYQCRGVREQGQAQDLPLRLHL